MASEQKKLNTWDYIYTLAPITMLVALVLFILFLIKLADTEREQSQILCLKHHTASKCSLGTPTNEIWNYCIQHNEPKNCGRKPY